MSPAVKSAPRSRKSIAAGAFGGQPQTPPEIKVAMEADSRQEIFVASLQATDFQEKDSGRKLTISPSDHARGPHARFAGLHMARPSASATSDRPPLGRRRPGRWSSRFATPWGSKPPSTRPREGQARDRGPATRRRKPDRCLNPARKRWNSSRNVQSHLPPASISLGRTGSEAPAFRAGASSLLNPTAAGTPHFTGTSFPSTHNEPERPRAATRMRLCMFPRSPPSSRRIPP
jgi:hypothetical protein